VEPSATLGDSAALWDSSSGPGLVAFLQPLAFYSLLLFADSPLPQFQVLAVSCLLSTPAVVVVCTACSSLELFSRPPVAWSWKPWELSALPAQPTLMKTTAGNETN
jgi:hypothetical protein